MKIFNRSVYSKQEQKIIQNRSKRVFKGFRTLILSRHSTHDILRNSLPRNKFRSLVRLGSTTVPRDGKQRIEINSVQAVKNSASKLLMKQCFTRAGIRTADWYRKSDNLDNMFNNGHSNEFTRIDHLPYPIVAKSHMGSRGEGNTKLDTADALRSWMVGRNLNNYIFEKFYNFTREYRYHVTKNGCFYTCRKMLKEGTPDHNKWYRNDSNCVWIMENNPQYDAPVNQRVIIDECVKALKAIGLDIGAFDVKVQSRLDGRGRIRPEPDFIIIESGSAPSFGDVTAQKYIVEIGRLLNEKYRGR